MRNFFGVALVALVLAGCSAAPISSELTAADKGGAPTSEPTHVAEETPVAEPTPTETPWPYTMGEDAEARFLSAMRNGSTYGMEDVSDAELIGYAHLACEQMAAGVSSDNVELFAEEQPDAPYANYNDINLAGIASEMYCREFNHISE